MLIQEDFIPERPPVPIYYSHSHNNNRPTNNYLQLPICDIDIEYVIVYKSEQGLYKCYKDNTWVKTFCKRCSKFLCNDYSTISNHCLRKHKNETYEKFAKKGILKFIFLNNQYMSIVENKYFKNLFEFDIFSRRSIFNYLSLLKNKVRDLLEEELSKYEHITIYFDEWSKFQHNFLGVTASTYDKIFLLELLVPDDIERTKEVISSHVNLTLNNYNISTKITFQCTDCGSNVLNLIENVEWFPCCNHILNRCIDDLLEFLPKAKDLALNLSSLRYSQKFKRFLLLHSDNFTAFPNYCVTRWYSLADIFKRAQECRVIIENYQKYLIHIGKKSLKKGIEFFTLNDFCLISVFSDFFNDVKYIMMDIEKDDADAIFWAQSNIMTIYFDLCDQLIRHGFQEAAIAFRQGLINRCIKYHKHHFLFNLLIGGFLNPFINFQQILFPEEDLPKEYKNLENQFMDYLQTLAPDAFRRETNNTYDRHFLRRGESYFAEPQNMNEIEKLRVTNIGERSNIVQWWEFKKNEMPALYKIAKRFCALRPSSASIERIFSKGKYLLDDYTGAMTKENMAKRIYLYCNKELTEKAIEEIQIY